MNNQSEKIQNDFETSPVENNQVENNEVENNEVEINQVENNEAEEKNRAFKLFLSSISETDYLQYNGKKIKFGGVVHKRAILELNLPLPLGWEFTVVPRRIPKPRKPVKPRIKREPKIKTKTVDIENTVNTVDIENTVNIENIEKLVEAKRKSIIQKYETKKTIDIFGDSDTEELKERIDTRRSLCEPQMPIVNSTNLKVGFSRSSCIPVRNTQIGSLRQVGQIEEPQIAIIEYTSQTENMQPHNNNVGNWCDDSRQEIYFIDGYTETFDENIIDNNDNQITDVHIDEPEGMTSVPSEQTQSKVDQNTSTSINKAFKNFDVTYGIALVRGL